MGGKELAPQLLDRLKPEPRLGLWVVDHPTYPPREAIEFSFRNGTWSGQGDRHLDVETSRRPGEPHGSATGEEAEPWRAK